MGIGLEFQQLALMGFGQLGQGVALLVAQLGLGLLLAGQGGFDVGTAGFLAFRVAGLLLAVRDDLASDWEWVEARTQLSLWGSIPACWLEAG